jgi:hypothetical protein
MLPIVDAVREVTGQEISTVSAWRFCTVGRNGHKLKYWALGAKKLTTPQAVLEWMEAIAGHGEVSEPTVKSGKRSRQIDRELDKELV